ncbi:hypothetical protein SLEP1_g22384 [Rubroshorea leprosula]|uniref:Uncharacterized protein n=1 Tax=Rubroshorea leprosula TaxID=152421 RepID=A0AAV5JJX0_9ROSI|nr:hypothetical protein SLEP1_g22384 [Rubroshorea leprosula]
MGIIVAYSLKKDNIKPKSALSCCNVEQYRYKRVASSHKNSLSFVAGKSSSGIVMETKLNFFLFWGH